MSEPKTLHEWDDRSAVTTRRVRLIEDKRGIRTQTLHDGHWHGLTPCLCVGVELAAVVAENERRGSVLDGIALTLQCHPEGVPEYIRLNIIGSALANGEVQKSDARAALAALGPKETER